MICGDYNTAHRAIDLARPKENAHVSGFLPIERQWIDGFIAAGFVDTLREFHPEPELYSWWDMQSRARDRNVGWRIDYQIITPGLIKSIRSASIFKQERFSDHAPLIMDYDFGLAH